eukprot:jgi/Mesvir1/28585/Mv00999-RA.2
MLEWQYSGAVLEGPMQGLMDGSGLVQDEPVATDGGGKVVATEQGAASDLAAQQFVVLRYGDFRERGRDVRGELRRANVKLMFTGSDLARIAAVGWAGDCSDYARVWEPVGGALEASKGACRRGGASECGEHWEHAEDVVGCDAYAMAQDLRWVDLVDVGWVDAKYEDAFSSLMELARQVRHARGEKEGPDTRISLGGCQCAPVQDVSSLSPNVLRAMLFTALSAQASLSEKISEAKDALQVAGVGDDKEDVIVVGNSGGVVDLPRDMGDLIDTFGTVVRINAKYYEELSDRIGRKRDVWVMGDYRTSCGCWNGRCCTDEQLAAIWHRLGDNVRAVLGVAWPPRGASERGVAFTKVILRGHSHHVINFWLWRHNMLHPGGSPLRRLRVDANLRSGLTTVLTLLFAGCKPTIVGFDLGGMSAMRPGIFFTLKERHSGDPAPHVLSQYEDETWTLMSLRDAGLIHVLDGSTGSLAGRGGGGVLVLQGLQQVSKWYAFALALRSLG